jgi:hypothetical protein
LQKNTERLHLIGRPDKRSGISILLETGLATNDLQKSLRFRFRWQLMLRCEFAETLGSFLVLVQNVSSLLDVHLFFGLSKAIEGNVILSTSRRAMRSQSKSIAICPQFPDILAKSTTEVPPYVTSQTPPGSARFAKPALPQSSIKFSIFSRSSSTNHQKDRSQPRPMPNALTLHGPGVPTAQGCQSLSGGAWLCRVTSPGL